MLGFAEAGAKSATTGRSTRPESEKGDQIWVWQNNGWSKFYWLIGSIGPAWDGRWWDDRIGGFGVFYLSPGEGYYYKARGADFPWTPTP